MSTKIYNGFRFSSSDWEDIHRLVMEWRTELRVLHLQAVHDFVARVAVGLVDGARLLPGTSKGDVPLLKASGLLMDMQAEVKRTQRRNPVVDFDFVLSLFPFEGKVYGIVYTEQREWLRLWMEKPFLSEFGYWNNTDQPEDVSDEEWLERERIWNGILDPAIADAPSMAGFAADCTHDSVFPDTEAVVAAQPSFAERVHRLALSSVMARRMREMELAGSASGEAAVATRPWLRSDEGLRALQGEEARIAALIEPVITREMLIREIG